MFAEFVTNVVTGYIGADTQCIIDNALIHQCHESRVAMEAAFPRGWYYCSRYSPHLKPVEPSFALVKKYVKDHEHEIRNDRDAVALIYRAFHYYTIGQTGAASIRGHWDIYFNL